MPPGLSHKLRKILIATLVAMMLFVQNAHPLFVPKAQAFPTEIMSSIPDALGTVWKFISETITTAAMSALLNGAAYLTRKIAYDTAVFIAEGGQGKGALIFKDGVDEYLLKVAGDTAGEAISGLGEPFGLNLCQIPDPRINVYLQVGLRSIFPDGTEPKPKCSWQELSQQWGRIGEVLEERYGKGGSKFASHVFNASLSVSQSDFGVAMGAIAKVDENMVQAGLSASIERLVAEGSKDVKSLISGEVLTPAAVINKKIGDLSKEAGSDTINTHIAGLYGSELKKLPLIGANVFLNTLASQLLSKVFTGLFPPSSPALGGAGGSFSFFDQAPRGFRAQAEKALGFLLAPTIQEVNVYNILDEYSACPDAPGLNHCVMDDGLRQAIQRSTQKPITIKEAMDQGLLHADWALISPRREEDNTNIKECYLNQYCYSNLQKLRKIRVLPLGFELASLKSDPDQPWTLGQVVAGFDDCNAQNIPDARRPFCHLIDPNWVIKVPAVRCQSQLFGPILVDKGAPVRHDECMDLQTCVREDSEGVCQTWGYCTRERNTWRLGGEPCPSYYNTCTAYQNLTDASQANYLSRTVDVGECSAQSVGCRAYSSEQQNDQWVTQTDVTRPAGIALKQLGRPEIFYFNKQAQTCASEADGCSVFYSGQRGTSGQFILNNGNYVRDLASPLYLKRAPDYLGCYDINRAADSPVINWPQTRVQAINDVSNHPRCREYAAACAPSEVGCELYKPAAGNGTPIPGVVGEANACDARCVGYETFRQETSNFEAAAFPLYFIPASGGQCNANDAGCDEFTNLESAAAGGEQTQYYSYIRACERPTETNEKTFFSWEGSEREGYVLRAHSLLPVDQIAFTYFQGLANNPAGPANLNFNGLDAVSTVFPIGSPAYNDTTVASLQNKYNKCNATGYSLLINNPLASGAASADCRALYDNAGNIYYRLLSDTVTVSNQCVRLRKTESRLYVDAALTAATRAQAGVPADQNLCQSQGGLWGDENSDGQNDCQRCFGGGRYRDGVCVYQTIAAEATQCSAESVGCRAYTGNSGNNVNPRVIYDSFETTATSTDAVRAVIGDWIRSPQVRLAAESLQVGGHSLEVNISEAWRMIATGTLQFGEWYEVEFWTRGAVQNLSVALAHDLNENGAIEANELAPQGRLTRDAARNQDVSVTVSGDWRRHRLGPVRFDGRSNVAGGLVFSRAAVSGQPQGPYYLDFVRLGKLEDRLYLIKNSWQTPLLQFCDATPTDLFPGAALGCQAYTDSLRNPVFVTGFSALCREAAIGCQPVFQTRSRDVAKIYNLRCLADSNQMCRITVNNRELGSCRVSVGQTSCYIPEITLPQTIDLAMVNTAAPGAVVSSTIYIPVGASAPVFLANQEKFHCRESEKGCTRLGRQNQLLPGDSQAAIQYSDVYLINDPDTYIRQGESGAVQSGILCRAEILGCGEFKAGPNTVYFKDPKLTGNSLCEYKTDVPMGASKRSGWFRQGVDPPSPCYPAYQDPGGKYGIWSNRSAPYRGFVGACTIEANQCAELIDTFDRQGEFPAGRPYYRIYDERLTGQIKECDSQVSLKEGCVLFDRTDQPNKLYSTTLTYSASDTTRPRYGLVNPISQSDRSRNDANLILKVDRDRSCSEWLACRNKVIITYETGAKQRLCNQFRACNAAEPGKECANYPDSPLDNRFLDERAYISRDVSWFGADYSGYSLLNRYQITDYTYVAFPGDLNQYLAYRADDRLFRADGDRNDPMRNDFSRLGCIPDPNVPAAQRQDRDGQSCGLDNQGRCYQDKCLYPIEGTQERRFDPVEQFGLANTAEQAQILSRNISKIRTGINASSCKGYPEDDSPFPEYLAEQTPATEGPDGDLLALHETITNIQTPIIKQRRRFSNVNREFQSAHLCGLNEGDCSCQYEKLEYDNGTTDYVTSTLQTTPDGICTGGDRNGYPCANDRQCITYLAGLETDDNVQSRGTCSRLKKKEPHFGIKGFCLEPDLSRPINGLVKPGTQRQQEYACLTWIPIQTSVTRVDLLNRFQEAGYWPVRGYDGPEDGSLGGELYCAATDRGGYYDNAAMPAAANTSETIAALTDWIYRFTYEARGAYGLRRIVLDDNCPSGSSLLSPRGRPIDGFGDSWGINQDIFESGSQIASIVNNVARNGSSPDVIRAIFCPRLVINRPARPAQARAALAYQVIQSWAWRNLGSNTVVATIDSVGRINAAGQDEWSAAIEPVYQSPIIPTEPREGSQFMARNIDKVYFLPVRYEALDRFFPDDNGEAMVFPQFFSSEYVMDMRLLRSLNGSAAIRPAGARAVLFYNNDSIHEFLARRDGSQFFYNVCAPGQDYGNGYIDGCDEGRDLTWAQQWSYVQRGARLPEVVRSEGVTERYAWVFFPVETQPRRFGNISDGYTRAPGWTQNLDFAQAPQDGVNDPFSPSNISSCDGSIGIAFDFDANGNLTATRRKTCSSLYFLTNFAIIVEFKNQCAEYVQVYNEAGGNALSGTTNKAWTNRVWNSAQRRPGTPYQHPLGDYGEQGVQDVFTVATPKRPFASLPLPGQLDMTDPANRRRLLEHSFEDPGDQTDANRRRDGIPYSCADSIYTNSVDLRAIRACSFSLTSPYRQLVNGAAFMNVLQGNGVNVASQALFELFAQQFQRARLNSDRANYNTTQGQDRSGELLEARITRNGTPPLAPVIEPLTAPRVFSLNPATCFIQGATCTAAEADNLTVNQRNQVAPLRDYDGNRIFEEDDDRDGFPDAIISRNSETVTLQFFAAADDNRMPIRQVTVDWRDGAENITNDGVRGLYKNHKPLCGSSNNTMGPADVGLCLMQNPNTPNGQPVIPSNLTCNSSADCPRELLGTAATEGNCMLPTTLQSRSDTYSVPRFGNAPRACVSAPFEFEHTYLCSRSALDATLTDDGFVKSVNSLPEPIQARLSTDFRVSPSDRVCVYRPRVHVRDNWGYCNGRCPGGAAGEECYGVTETNNECNYNDPTNIQIGNTPWTEYRGYIIVVPQR